MFTQAAWNADAAGPSTLRNSDGTERFGMTNHQKPRYKLTHASCMAVDSGGARGQSRATFFSPGSRQDVNSTWYPEIEEPSKSREKHYSLVLYILIYFIHRCCYHREKKWKRTLIWMAPHNSHPTVVTYSNIHQTLRVCPREDQAGVAHAISPIFLKLGLVKGSPKNSTGRSRSICGFFQANIDHPPWFFRENP